MTKTKEKTAVALTQAKDRARRESDATYRTILISASVGMLIGLLVRR